MGICAQEHETIFLTAINPFTKQLKIGDVLGTDNKTTANTKMLCRICRVFSLLLKRKQLVRTP